MLEGPRRSNVIHDMEKWELPECGKVTNRKIAVLPSQRSPGILISVMCLEKKTGLLRESYYERGLKVQARAASLQDDTPNPAQTKLSPLAQVMRPTSAAAVRRSRVWLEEEGQAEGPPR